MAGIRRLRPAAQPRERRPITRSILEEIVSTFDQNSLRGAILHAAFCLAFAAFLRIGEFTWEENMWGDDFAQWHITRGSLLLSEDRLQLTLPASKTDPFRQGVTVTVAAVNDEACPVRSLRILIERFPTDLTQPMFYPKKAFTRNFVTKALRDVFKDKGYQGNYSCHSFRRGAATSAKNAGLNENEIKLLRR